MRTKEKLSIRLDVWTTQTDKDTLRRLAQERKTTLSAVVRSLIRGAGARERLARNGDSDE